MKRTRLLTLLVLLMMAATGVWAADGVKHTITASYGTKTTTMDVTLPYEKTIGEVFSAMGGVDIVNLTILTNVSSSTPAVVSIGEFDGWNTPVSVIADGEATVTLSVDYMGSPFSFDITVTVALPPYTVSMKDGVEDADKWTVKTGTGDAQAMPIGGLKEGDTVTLTYTGRLKVKGIKATSDAIPVDPLAVPLTMEVIEAGSIVVKVNGTTSNHFHGIKYSLDGGQTKTTITSTKTIDNLAAGDKVQFYGIGTSNTAYGFDTEMSISGGSAKVKVYGNVMSLFDEDDFTNNYSTLPNPGYSLYYLFGENEKLTDASGLLLPATTLRHNCYRSMFNGCTNLAAGPAELPAETLADYCYKYMFTKCSNLTAGPDMPAPTLVNSCYDSMFRNCSKLASVTCLATSGINVSSSTDNWLNDAGTQATGTKTFTADPSATWPSGPNGIPDGWKRLNPDGTDYVPSN